MIRTGLPAALGLALAGLVLAAPPAAATMEGPCQARLEGVDVAPLDSSDADDAVALNADAPAHMNVTADQPIERWNASIHYGPTGAPLTKGQTPTETSSVEAVIPVHAFSWLGAGLYTVTGSVQLADGTTCEGEALVDVQADVLGTVVGAGSAAVVGIAGIGLVAAGRDGYRLGNEENPPP
jgi:hypothetical protein